MAKELGAPYHLLKETARLKRLPVVSPSSQALDDPGRHQGRRLTPSTPSLSSRSTSLPVESPRPRTLRS